VTVRLSRTVVRSLVHSQYCKLTAFVLSCGLYSSVYSSPLLHVLGVRLNQKTLIVGEILKSLPHFISSLLIGRSIVVTTRTALLRRGPSLVASKDLTISEVSPRKSPAALQLG